MKERQVCRICNHNYDILNAPNACGICRKQVNDEDNVRSCNCKFRKHHKDCVQKNVESNYKRCLYCKEDFATTQTVSWRLTSKYLQKTLCCVAKAFAIAGKGLTAKLSSSSSSSSSSLFSSSSCSSSTSKSFGSATVTLNELSAILIFVGQVE